MAWFNASHDVGPCTAAKNSGLGVRLAFAAASSKADTDRTATAVTTAGAAMALTAGAIITAATSTQVIAERAASAFIGSFLILVTARGSAGERWEAAEIGGNVMGGGPRIGGSVMGGRAIGGREMGGRIGGRARDRRWRWRRYREELRGLGDVGGGGRPVGVGDGLKDHQKCPSCCRQLRGFAPRLFT